MSKLLIAITVIATAYSFSASAAGYGTAGCGLGSMVFKDQKGAVQILAATTNGTFGNQTFGITTGTSNCNDGKNLIGAYINTNYDAIKTGGQGEALIGLAKVYNCGSHELSQALKTNYQEVFKSQDAQETKTHIDNVINSTPALKATCQA